MTMTPKPTSLAWLVALQYLGSVLGAIVLLFILLAIVGFLVPELVVLAGTAVGQVVLAIIYLAILWFTTWQTVRFLRRRYVIPDTKKLIMWSSCLFVLIQVLIWLWAFVSIGAVPGLMDLGSTVISLAVFYLATRKYLS